MDLYVLPIDVVEGSWKRGGDLHSIVDEVYDTLARLPGSKVGEILVYVDWSEVEWVVPRGCGPAGSQWDNQDGKAAAGSGKDCGVGQGSTLLGWGFLRLVGWQYRKINKTNHILLNVIEISYRMYFSSFICKNLIENKHENTMCRPRYICVRYRGCPLIKNHGEKETYWSFK